MVPFARPPLIFGLAHNEWDPTAKTSRTKVLYSFGRADQLDRAAIERLITALTRVVGVDAVSTGPDRVRMVGVPGLEFVESRPLGGAWLLDRLWHRLGIDTLLRRLAGNVNPIWPHCDGADSSDRCNARGHRESRWRVGVNRVPHRRRPSVRSTHG
ncbi:MAG: hypothetical protein AB7H43_14270 [Acidimicrobiia bacterium]